MANLKITGDLEVVGKIKKDDVKVSLPSESGTLATEEYVEENGGKIASISVNGVQQTIDKDKNVEITIDTKTPVYDGLDSESTEDALSANQGKVLDEKIAGLESSKLSKVTDTAVRYRVYGVGYNTTDDAIFNAYPGTASSKWLAMYNTGGTLTAKDPTADTHVATKLYADSKLKKEIVESLPTENIDPQTLYLLPNEDAKENSTYTTYMYINEAWEIIGSQHVDLENYYTKDEIDDKISTGGSGGTTNIVWEVWK